MCRGKYAFPIFGIKGKMLKTVREELMLVLALKLKD